MYLNKKLLLIFAVILVSGCSSSPRTTQLYGWQEYQPTIYQYYVEDQTSPREQIASLETTLETAKSQNTALPPGFYAHLAMLYANNGDLDKAKFYFSTEKEQFPESAHFMDFLLSKEKVAKK